MHKLTFLLLILSFAIVNAKDSNYPSKFSVITYTVGNYGLNSMGEPWRSNNSLRNDAADSLVSSFENNITTYYPGTRFGTPKKYKDAAVTRSRFTSNESNNYNFVYYSGHGNVNRITMYPDQERVYNTDKRFGGKTYWVMIKSCLVFRNGEADQDPWFNGVHSILGYSSLSYTHADQIQIKVRCGINGLAYCTRTQTRSTVFVERDFATNWIKEKQTILDAYINAVYKWSFEAFGFGIEPKIVYRYGYVDGKFFDPWEEKFESSIQKPVFRNAGEYTGIGSRWCTMGTPEYE